MLMIIGCFWSFSKWPKSNLIFETLKGLSIWSGPLTICNTRPCGLLSPESCPFTSLFFFEACLLIIQFNHASKDAMLFGFKPASID